MKKLSIALLSIFLTICGIFFAACGESKKADLQLSQSQVVIYFGETENNKETVNVLPVNINVDSLSVFYDRTNITITSSAKKADGSFDLYITPNGERGCEDVEVTVRAGANTEKTFLVTVVVPVTDIVADSDISIAYGGGETTYNLVSHLSFVPDATKQTNVSFEILTQGMENKATIVGTNLVLSSEFDYFDEELRIVVQSLDKSGIRKEFGVKVVPSAIYFASQMEMFRFVGGSEVPILDEGYTLNIENGAFSEPFEIGMRIPASLGIDVNVNSAYSEQTNIMSFLNYTKTSETIIRQGEQYLQVVFEFESLNLKTGVGNLFFEFYYINSSNKNLSSMFVITETTIVEALPIKILVPMRDIGIETSCDKDPGGAYIVYKNYSQSAKGSAFVINALPNNTTERTLVLGSIMGVDVYKWSAEHFMHIQLQEGAEITSGETLLIAGQQDVAIGKIIITNQAENGAIPTVSKTLNFAINSGASALGFVENEADINPTTRKEVAVERGDVQGTLVLLYAPNTTISDISHERTLLIVPKATNFYDIIVVSNTIGSKEYVISTANGFEVVLVVQTIQPVETANVIIKHGDNLEGIGRSTMMDGSVVDISIKNGYSIQLEYNINDHAEIAEIQYSFSDAILGEGKYTSAYAQDYINFSKATATDYVGYSTVLSTSNIKDAHILTALSDGKVVIKVAIFGYVVEMGKVVKTGEPIEKYICVEVYSPIKDITSTGKTIELRAQNQLSDTDYDKSIKVIDLNALASGNKVATYNKIYIDGATYMEFDNKIEYVYENDNADGKMWYKATLDISTNQLTVVVYSIPNNYDFGVQNIVLFATDFYLETDCNLNVVKQNHEVITYPINLHIIQTSSISDINITSLKCVKVEGTTTKIKTYERIYLDVSKSSSGTNVYKIKTEVLPLDAFNKELKYSFVPDANYSTALVDVSSNDGAVYYSGSEGGTGYIYITPKDNDKIKVIIPITVADGSSWETAFEITSLAEVKNPNKHYIITTLSTLELTSPLFNGTAFRGGLYGNREGEISQATIKLNGCSLFDVISAGAVVQNITLYGDAVANGFVANENHGKIQNVSVTTYIINGVYVPSLLTAKNGATSAGGLVGINTGSILSCEFAGSIKKSESTLIVNGIAGINDSGNISADTFITVAKFEGVIENAGRVISDGNGGYINGILECDGGLSGSGFTGTIHQGSVLDGNEYVKTIAFADGGYQALGGANAKYGIMFYFSAKDATKQQFLNEYNIIKKTDLIASTCDQIKLVVVDTNGASSNIASVSGENITISGVGEFALRIYSAHDYTKYVSINMLSLYYFSEFGIYNDGRKIEIGEEFAILKGGRDTIYSQTSNIVNEIEIKENPFVVNFTLDGNKANNYIAGSGVGEHTINAMWQQTESTLLVNIATGYALEFDKILNEFFCDSDNYAFKIMLKLGTTKVETSAESGSIEPKDGIPFNAIITTDVNTDKIVGGENGSVEIINSSGLNCTSAFNIYVGEQKEFGNLGNQYSFEITLSLKDENRKKKEYVDQTYTIRIRAINTNNEKYSAYATYKLTILPQSLADIGVSLYNFQSSDDTGYNLSSVATPTSVLLPTESGLLALNLFPNYTTYDYVEIVATSNTLARLAYRVQKETEPNHFEFDNSADYDVLPDANGIRLKNNFNIVDSEDIGTYYILIFATNTLDQDAIFNLDIKVSYRGETLIATTFTLFVRMPASPQVNINGKTSVYAYPGERLVANVVFPEDQVLIGAGVYAENILLNNIAVESKHIATTGGFNQYQLLFTIPKNHETPARITLKVRSLKVDKGQQIEPKPAELQVYVVSFKMPENSIGIQNAIDGIFNISSIKYSNIELYANLLAYFENGFNEAVESFKENYYYSNGLGFNVPTNDDISIIDTLKYKAEVLSTYLYYVNGNQQAPIAHIDGEGNIKISPNNWYENLLSFNLKDIKDENGNIIDRILQVRGGEATGEVPMLLQFHYETPDGATYVYEYRFTIVNDLYTTEDMPIEITSSNAFLAVAEAENPQDYILANDIYLYEYEVMADTSKIKSLDGNNYTIHIMSFASNQQIGASYALFNTITAETTIKNLTVNYYYLDEIKLSEEITEINVAGLAINNNGIVANTEVMAYVDGREKTPTFTTFGIKIKTAELSTANVNTAGFVLNNMGSISNSRVGGDNKMVTKFDYTIEDNPTLKQTYANAHMFTIRASGTISGFVYNNTGVISSSFAKNLNIVNTYNKNETKVSAGFVNTNEGTITMSYVEGEKGVAEIQALGGGIEATGIMAGFVYSNHGEISDSYSNIMLHTSNNQVGRLGAGFVYHNSAKGVITSSYSFSSIGNNNTAQLNFAGITDLMQYNNLGTIKNCYYYITDDMDTVSIESMYNTEIYSITNTTSVLNFYGFSFSDKSYNRNATWQMTSTGPTLVSANDIAHSVRYKVNRPGAGDSSLNYYYVYYDEFDYGTKNNPIIIRDAKELNGALGGYRGTNSEIEKENFDIRTGKIYGSYRLVNHIDLTELIIEEREDTDYKYNLASTTMTLSGEQAETSKRAGTFNGNGLTISNLAISNSQTAGSENYGMFKSIENGASFTNVKIVLAKGGVKADNTTCVGTVAGTLKDSSLINVHISTENPQEHTDIIGANVVGGAVGRVINNSFVFGVSVENVSVIATYFRNEDISADINNGTGIINNNTYIREDQVALQRNSLAGGAFGVLDIYVESSEEFEQDIEAIDVLQANAQNIKTTGGMTISGMTVGGVAGYIGKRVVAKDLALVITTKEARLTAYNCFAGGIVGYNSGFIYQARVEHEQTWQSEIENQIGEYYRTSDAQSRQDMDIGNLNLFQTTKDDAVQYKPFAIGGIVGLFNNGSLNISYSKAHVRNNYSKYAGGAIGFINKDRLPSSEETRQAYISQVYVTGDVYAGAEVFSDAYIGGIIGRNLNEYLALDKVNALNMWSYETLSNINDKTIDLFVNVETDNLDNLKNDIKDLGTFGGNVVKFETGATTQPDTTLSTAVNVHIVPYYSYKGLEVDGGAQIDVAFKDNGWYDTDNWVRDIDEVYPHIRFTLPTSIYTIEDIGDFWKFSYYGANADAKFVVIGSEPISCQGVQQTYSILRGSIVGAEPGAGFAGLTAPLFEEAIGATVSSLKFTGCKSAFIIRAKGGCNFTNLTYEDCIFSNPHTDDTSYNYAGIVYSVRPNVDGVSINFKNITIDEGCSIGPDSPTTAEKTNIGFLFAKSEGSQGSVNIDTVKIIGVEPNVDVKINNSTNLGYMVGLTQVATQLKNCIVEDNLTAIFAGGSLTRAADKTTNIGLYVGSASSNITIINSTIGSGAKVQLKVSEGCDTSNQTVKVGGLVGNAQTMNFESTEFNNSYSANFAVQGSYKSLHVGGLVGYASSFNYNIGKNINISVGGGSVESTQMKVDASGLTYVGGILGQVETMQPNSEGQGAMSFNGDIKINQSTADGTVYVGGIVGHVTSDANIQNINVGGTIRFGEAGDAGATYYIGGAMGYNKGANTKLKDVYVLTDIELSGGNESDPLTNKEEHFIGGIAGQTSKNITLKDVVSLATIFMLYDKSNLDETPSIDAIGNIAEDGQFTGNATYASNINLCVSKHENGNGITNKTYSEARDAMTNVAVKSLSPNTQGSKFNPLKFDSLINREQSNTNYKVEQNGTELTVTGISERRIYAQLDGDIKLREGGTKCSISLNNVMVFSDGSTIYAELTPFNKIDSTSAVSGIVSKVYINNVSTNSIDSQAGFVNENNGVIYTCSVQEPMASFEDKDSLDIKSQFYSYINISSNSNKTVGGFVGVNNGYIFGSNSNAHIHLSNGSGHIVGGFVGNNKGLIDYSYSSGYVSNTNGKFNSLDLFGKDDGSGKNTTNSYTIFANLVQDATNITSTTIYDQDASEIILEDGDVELFGNIEIEDWDTKGYYSVDIKYNSYYPYLGVSEDMTQEEMASHPFKEMTYLSRNSSVVKKQSEEGVDYYDFNNNGATGTSIYYMLPTITAFEQIDEYEQVGVIEKGIFAGKDVVLTRTLNVGYKNGTGESELRKYDEESEGVISTFSQIFDGYGNAIKNIILTKNNLFVENNGTIENLTIQNIELSTSKGFIGENNGTINNIKIYGNVNINTEGISENGAYSIFVSQNNDSINNVELEAFINYNGGSESSEYTFGAIVGDNWGTVENCTLRNTSLIIKELKLSNNENPDDVYLVVGGIVGTNCGSVLTSGIKSTNIVVVNSGTVYVGGIVGETTAGSYIEQCYVDQPETKNVSNIIGGSDHETNELVPAQYKSTNSLTLEDPDGERTEEIEAGQTDVITQEAYVGGIVGWNFESQQINDCQNCGNIVARARWKAVDGYSERYKYSEELNQIVMYVYMESLAYAGGISGYGANIDSSKNFGEVRGGFRAWKPVAYIGTNTTGRFSSHIVGTVSTTLGGVGTGVAVYGLYTFVAGKLATSLIGTTVKSVLASVPGYGWMALIALEVIVTVVSIYETEQQKARLETVSVEITHIPGNSNFKVSAGEGSVQRDFEKQVAFGDFTSGSLYNIYITPKVIDNVQYAYSYILYNDLFNHEGYPSIAEKMTGQVRIGGTLQEILHVKNISGVTYKAYEGSNHEPQIYDYFDDGKYFTYDDAIHYDDWEFYPGSTRGKIKDTAKAIEDETDGGVLTALYYDPICPTLEGSDRDLYSKEGNFDILTTNYGSTDKSAVRLHTGAKYTSIDYAYKTANSYLEFSSASKALKQKYSIAEEPDFGDVWERNGGLIIAAPEPVKFIEVSDGGSTHLEYTLKDAKLWENLVYTVNKGIVNVEYNTDTKKWSGEPFEESEEYQDNPYMKQNVRIILDIPNELNQKIIVGNNTFDEFNGTIIAKDGEYFSNMDVYIENTTEYIGLIKQSSSATLENIKFDGVVSITYEQNGTDATKYKNMGILVGKVYAGGNGVKINNASVNIKSLELNNYAEHFISSFGGIVGQVNGTLTVETPTVTSDIWATIYALGDVNVAKGALPEVNGVGGIIGSVGSVGQVAINSANTDMSLYVVGEINYVGGIAGYNNGILIINDTTYVNATQISIASTGDAYAGGLVGYNQRILTVNGTVNICNFAKANYSKIISADVLDGNKTAYAGGVIGSRSTTGRSSLLANITVGYKGNLSNYNEALYIVAGTNAYVISNGAMAIPTEAYANKFIGNGEISDNHINAYNVVIKKVAIENNFNVGGAVVLAPELDVDLPFDVSTDNKTISFTRDEIVGSVPGIVNSMTYELKHREYKADEQNVYEYYLNFKYKDQSSVYEYEKKADGSIGVKEDKGDLNIEFNMTYLIRIVKDLANLNSTNEYMIQIINLNYGNVQDFYNKLANGILAIKPGVACIIAEGTNNPQIIQSQKFQLGTTTTIALGGSTTTRFAPTGKEIIIQNTLNSLSTNLTAIAESKDENTGYITAQEFMLYSKGTELQISGNTINLVETLGIESFTTKQEGKRTSGEALVSQTEDSTTISRTLFSLGLPETSTRGIEYGATAVSSGYNSYFDNYYDNENTVSTTKYTKDNTVILSAVVGVGEKGADGKYDKYDVYEWVLVDGQKIGYMSYRLSKQAYSSIAFAKRLESHMPVWTDGADKTISNLVYEFN